MRQGNEALKQTKKLAPSNLPHTSAVAPASQQVSQVGLPGEMNRASLTDFSTLPSSADSGFQQQSTPVAVPNVVPGLNITKAAGSAPLQDVVLPAMHPAWLVEAYQSGNIAAPSNFHGGSANPAGSGVLDQDELARKFPLPEKNLSPSSPFLRSNLVANLLTCRYVDPPTDEK